MNHIDKKNMKGSSIVTNIITNSYESQIYLSLKKKVYC